MLLLCCFQNPFSSSFVFLCRIIERKEEVAVIVVAVVIVSVFVADIHVVVATAVIFCFVFMVFVVI
jgi:hypothetical protein